MEEISCYSIYCDHRTPIVRLLTGPDQPPLFAVMGAIPGIRPQPVRPRGKFGVGRPRLPRRPRPHDRRIKIDHQARDGYRGTFEHLRMIVTESLENDARWWTHLSVSRLDGTMPSYDDLKLAKRMTLGPDRKAIQLFLPDAEHIDVAGKMAEPKQVLHLWSTRKMPIPDFSRGLGVI